MKHQPRRETASERIDRSRRVYRRANSSANVERLVGGYAIPKVLPSVLSPHPIGINPHYAHTFFRVPVPTPPTRSLTARATETRSCPRSTRDAPIHHGPASQPMPLVLSVESPWFNRHHHACRVPSSAGPGLSCRTVGSADVDSAGEDHSEGSRGGVECDDRGSGGAQSHGCRPVAMSLAGHVGATGGAGAARAAAADGGHSRNAARGTAVGLWRDIHGRAGDSDSGSGL